MCSPRSGGRPTCGVVPAVELERHRQARELADLRVREARDHAARERVRVGEHLVDRLDRPRRNVRGVERGAELVAVPGLDRRGQLRHHFLTPAHAVGVRSEPGVAPPRFEPEHAAQVQPVLVARGDVQPPAVGAAEARRRHAAGMLGAEPRRHLAEREISGRREREQRDLPVDHREVDVAALPRRGAARQRGEDRDRDPQPGGEVGHRQPGLHRPAAALAGEAHDPAHRLEDGVVAFAVRIRPALAEAGARDVDELLVQRPDGRVVEPVAGERPDREILDQHVGAAGEIADHRLPVGRAEVHGDRLLAAVDREVVRALGLAAALDERLEGARLVAAAAAARP